MLASISGAIDGRGQDVLRVEAIGHPLQLAGHRGVGRDEPRVLPRDDEAGHLGRGAGDPREHVDIRLAVRAGPVVGGAPAADVVDERSTLGGVFQRRAGDGDEAERRVDAFAVAQHARALQLGQRQVSA
jgi:hypothetical protein